jgi:deoxycytidylate deaminase
MDEKKQDKIDRLYMRMAFIWSENSYAIRRQVGALIVKDNSIISDGYNGTPSGFPNAGIRRVIYSRPYRLHQGVRLLKRAKIEVKQININQDGKEELSKEEH